MSADGPVPLSALAGWDLPALRGSAGTLQLVADRLTPWLTRVDALSRQLGEAECWSGPAGSAAGAALVELGSAGTVVARALETSSASLGTAVDAAAEAQENAATAYVVAASGPVTLTDAGVPAAPVPVVTVSMAPDQLAAIDDQERAGRQATQWATRAFDAAARVTAAATAAGDPLAALGVAGADAVDFGTLAVPAGPVPVLPAGAGPAQAAAWWAGLTPAARLAAVAADPVGVGGQDGVPAWARDRANRGLLEAALADPTAPGADTARATADQLAALAARDQDAQLVLFDAAAGLVALGVGDLDTADAVGVLVPGMNTDVAGDLDGMVVNARAVRSLAQAAAPGLAVATLVWLGYRTPGWGSFLLSANARSAGPVLDRTLDGLAAARAGTAAAGGPPLPRTTVVAHSYGTLVAGEAARAEGELAADALVLLGSPGTGRTPADGLEAEEVYGAWAPADPVSWSGWFGVGPYDGLFDEQPLPVDPGQGHTSYYDPAHPTLRAVAEVVAGVPVTGGDPG